MIKLQIIGNLGNDAVKKETESGKPFISFSVAHTEKFTSNGEPKQKTTWVNCTWWTEKLGVLPYLKKGATVYVEGQPEARAWVKDDNAVAQLTLRVGSLQLVGGRADNAGAQNNAGERPLQNNNSMPPEQRPEDITEPIDDLPF
jgi:single-strand DNA-binding protein